MGRKGHYDPAVDPYRLPTEARLTELTLRVRDLDVSRRFYREIVGLETVADAGDLVLGPRSGHWTITLVADPDAQLRPQPSIGLYHFALVVPDRPALARIMRHLDDRGWPLEGAADHGVSEALYLRDPEGNGIEIYRDRPRDDWPRDDTGLFAMSADPLDAAGILAASPAGGPLDPDTRFGHIHLHAPSLEDGEAFYADRLGLVVTQRSYVGALFMSAGGEYHHHVGLNVWARGRRAPEGATGLISYAWTVPDRAPPGAEPVDGATALIDPSGVRVLFRTG